MMALKDGKGAGRRALGFRLPGAGAQPFCTFLGDLPNRTTDLPRGLLTGAYGKGTQRMRWLDGITNSMDMSLSKLGVGEGQGGLACCSPWGCEESDMTERLN